MTSHQLASLSVTRSVPESVPLPVPESAPLSVPDSVPDSVFESGPESVSLALAPAVGPAWMHLLVIAFALMVLVHTLTRHR